MGVPHSEIMTNTDTAHDCHVHELELENDNASYDEEQHVIPGECSVCGDNVELVYNIAGVRSADTYEYKRIL